jgi:hypothetical protein
MERLLDGASPSTGADRSEWLWLRMPFILAWFMNFRADEWNDTWGAGGTDWTDRLVPALQRRQLVRTNYTFPQFRDNLMEF